MLDHLSIPTTNIERSAAFYDAVLAQLGIVRVKETPIGIGYGAQSAKAPGFWLLRRVEAGAAAPGLGLHISFVAKTPAEVDHFHAVAIAHGGVDAGAPGPRPEYTQPFYGAFVFDPDGFKIEAVCRE